MPQEQRQRRDMIVWQARAKQARHLHQTAPKARHDRYGKARAKRARRLHQTAPKARHDRYGKRERSERVACIKQRQRRDMIVMASASEASASPASNSAKGAT